MIALAELLRLYGEADAFREEVATMAFAGVTIDSRRSLPGGLFVALPGEHHDGHDFVEEALAGGCRGALVRADRITEARMEAIPARGYLWDDQRGWLRRGAAEGAAVLVLVPDPLEAMQRLAAEWRARFSPVVLGITGSVGKSSAKELIAAVLSRRFTTLKSPRSYNNEIGLPLTLLQLCADHEVVVLEMGTYGPGEITLLTEIARPQIGVVTNVSRSHLERMGRLEVIAEAKAELPAALPPNGLGVFNGDEALIRGMAEVTRAPVLYYGRGPDCDVRAVEVRSRGLAGISFEVEVGGERRELRCVLPGAHSVYHALAAVAVGRHLGTTWEEIEDGLLDRSARLRLLDVAGVGGATLIDDSYNASPTSCRAALDLLAELPGRKIAVLGDMLELGDFEERGHRLVGEWVAPVAKELYVLGERARWIAAAAQAQGMPGDRVHVADQFEEIVASLRDRLAPGDVVLVKGSRAMRMERIVAALRADREESSTQAER